MFEEQFEFLKQAVYKLRDIWHFLISWIEPTDARN